MCPTGEKTAELLQFCGDPSAGHPRTEKTVTDIERTFWWPSATKEFESYVKSRIACA